MYAVMFQVLNPIDTRCTGRRSVNSYELVGSTEMELEAVIEGFQYLTRLSFETTPLGHKQISGVSINDYLRRLKGDYGGRLYPESKYIALGILFWPEQDESARKLMIDENFELVNLSTI